MRSVPSVKLKKALIDLGLVAIVGSSLVCGIFLAKVAIHEREARIEAERNLTAFRDFHQRDSRTRSNRFKNQRSPGDSRGGDSAVK